MMTLKAGLAVRDSAFKIVIEEAILIKVLVQTSQTLALMILAIQYILVVISIVIQNAVQKKLDIL